MNAVPGKSVLFALLVAVSATPALAGEYSDPSGFSFSYPENWIAVAEPSSKGLNPNVFPPEIQKWLQKNGFSLDRLAMILIRDGKDEFLENVNVIVEPTQIVVDNDSAKKLLAVVAQGLQSSGGKLEDPQAHVQRFGDRDVIVLDYRAKFPGTSSMLQLRQVIVPGGGRTFIVTCTAEAEEFARHSKTFDAILASFKAPAPAQTRLKMDGPVFPGVDWGPGLAFGATCFVIGGAIWIVKKLATSKKRRSKAQRLLDNPPEQI